MQTVAFPIITSQNQEINRIQTNIQNTFNVVGNDIDAASIIGEIKYSTLNLDQVQRQTGPNWVACNGATCLKTTYNQITGFLVLPNIPTASGISAYIRIN